MPYAEHKKQTKKQIKQQTKTMQQAIKTKSNKQRSPTLQTVLMVDQFIKENSGEYKKTNLFKSLPKKMMWNTFQIIMNFLEESNRVGCDRDGYVIYVWNPEIYNKFKDRPSIKI